MNTQNVNINTAAQEPSERYGELTDAQIYDLFRQVQQACGGRTTGTMTPPSLPSHAVCFVLEEGDFDSLTVWVVDGWPVAASDDANWTHWQIAEEK